MKTNKKMKGAVLFAMSMVAAIGLMSCDKEGKVEPVVELEVQTAEDIPADLDQSGEYTFYSFENGVVASSLSGTKQWDIALRGTSILTNGGSSGPGQGGAQVVTGTLESVKMAPATGYFTDEETNPAIQGSDGQDAARPGWYDYTGDAATGPKHAVLTVPGRVIVLKTAEGNYAKMEILSYYKGNPDTSTDKFASDLPGRNGRHYTFRFVVQPNGSREF